MHEKSDLIKVEKYDKKVLSKILDHVDLFTVSYEDDDKIYRQIDYKRDIYSVLNSVNICYPYIIYLKEDRIESIGSECFHMLYSDIKSFEVSTKNFMYLTSLEGMFHNSISCCLVFLRLCICF